MKYKKLTIIEGTMFAGKTTKLINEILKYDSDKVLVFKPRVDTRSGLGEIRTHDGVSYPAISVSSAKAIREYVFQKETRKFPQAVFIDEAQFFDAEIVSVVKELIEFFPTYLCGLDKNYKNQIFGYVHNLRELASELVRLRADCTTCDSKADHNFRLIPALDEVVVGGSDEYQPRCSYCYTKATLI